VNNLYHCPQCERNLTRFECTEETEFVTSEAWGMREKTRCTYLVCGHCGSDVEEVNSCCTNERRNVDGECDNCGDPCL
jgi:hypothetical protein